jgi:Amt family ammonium transporter
MGSTANGSATLVSAPVDALEANWILTTATLIFAMQAGFGMLEAGSLRSPASLADILTKNIADSIACALAWWAFGYALSYQGDGPFLGSLTRVHFFAHDVAFEDDQFGLLYSSWLQSLVYASTCATIVSGALAERTKVHAHILCSLATVAFIYPTCAHWIWHKHGWLSLRNPDALLGGVLDFAGSAVVHLTGKQHSTHVRKRQLPSTNG